MVAAAKPAHVVHVVEIAKRRKGAKAERIQLMIVCKECGFKNTDADSFCGACGGFLEWTGEKQAAPAARRRAAKSRSRRRACTSASRR